VLLLHVLLSFSLKELEDNMASLLAKLDIECLMQQHRSPTRSLLCCLSCACVFFVSFRLKELEDNMASLLAEEAALAAEIAAEEEQRQRDLATLREKIEGGSGGKHDEL
jgi:hypothetical protein